MIQLVKIKIKSIFKRSANFEKHSCQTSVSMVTSMLTYTSQRLKSYQINLFLKAFHLELAPLLSLKSVSIGLLYSKINIAGFQCHAIQNRSK